MKIVKQFLLKIVIFTAKKNRCILHGHVFVLLQDSVSESETTSIARERWTVEDPPDGGVWAWIIVLACGVLHLCSELVYYIFYDTIVIGRFRNLRLVAFGLSPESTYMDFQVFEDVRLAGGTCCCIVIAFLSKMRGKGLLLL